MKNATHPTTHSTSINLYTLQIRHKHLDQNTKQQYWVSQTTQAFIFQSGHPDPPDNGLVSVGVYGKWSPASTLSASPYNTL